MFAPPIARKSAKKAANSKSGSARAPATLTLEPPHPDRSSPQQQPLWDFGHISLFAPASSASAPSGPPNNPPPRTPVSFPVLQAKLIIGSSGDPSEREADAAADRVMAMPIPTQATNPPLLPRQSLPSSEARRQAAGQSPPPVPGAAPPLVHQALRSPGRPLDRTTRGFFESRFGHDFSRIRIHTDTEAAASARSIGALAYAHGQNLVFAAGKYAPHAPAGRRLLAHELAHTVQQGAAATIRRAPDLHLQLQQQLTATDYDAAALTLNGMSDADMNAEIAALSPEIHQQLMDAVLRTMLVWNPPRVARALQAASPAEARKAQINFFFASVNAANWFWAGMVLNGFSDADIQLLLTKPPLKTDQLIQLRDKSPWWAVRIQKPITALLGNKAADEMAGMIGPKATWVPSNPHSGNTFQMWASAATQAAAPPLLPTTRINCWEMVLLAAFRAGVTTWQWIHDVYTASNAATGGDWFDYLVKQLTPGGRQTYKRNTPTGPQPSRGDIVFWNGAAHVALATGTRDRTGGQQVYSFWPPPGDAKGQLSNPDAIKITSIEILADFMDAHANLGPVKAVEFGPGPW